MDEEKLYDISTTLEPPRGGLAKSQPAEPQPDGDEENEED